MRSLVALPRLPCCFVLFCFVTSFLYSAPAPQNAPKKRDGSNLQQKKAQRTVLHRGMSWVAGRRVHDEDLENLLDVGVNWIVQTPFGWQSDIDSPYVRTRRSSRVFRGESDSGLSGIAARARKLGIKTMLKPHIWLTRPSRGKWRADIEMKTEADWKQWFASYRSFMLHYAKLAQESEMEALCIGTELAKTVVARKDDWLSLIKEIRAVYKGKLTYAANWWDEYEHVPFWKELDFIGIQAYFPLAKKDNPDVATLRKGWQTHIAQIEKLQKRIGKPVIFTELGYRAMEDAAIEPWRWVRGRPQVATEAGLRTQANCYRAFFEELWGREWLAGVYFWKWFPSLRRSGRVDFTPQGKPAESVLQLWYLAEKTLFDDNGSSTHPDKKR